MLLRKLGLKFMLLVVSNRMSNQTPLQDSLSDWRKEYLELKGSTLNEKQVVLLTEGPKSLAQSWALNAMYQDYKKMFKRYQK